MNFVESFNYEDGIQIVKMENSLNRKNIEM